MGRFRLCFIPSTGVGAMDAPTRVCAYLDYYAPMTDTLCDEGEGMPRITPVACSLVEFEGYVQQLRMELDQLANEARTRWG